MSRSFLSVYTELTCIESQTYGEGREEGVGRVSLLA